VGPIFAAISVILTGAESRNISGMRWFRAHRLFGGCLALFALAIQLVVSFAHIHPQDLFAKPEVGFGAKYSTTTGLADGENSLGKRTDNHGRGLPHDSCAICASINLISTALTVQGLVLSIPANFDSVQLQSISDFEFQQNRYSLFQTRAPPIA
jgi:hypothetical protein